MGSTELESGKEVMPESICIIFARATFSQLAAWLDRHAIGSDSNHWCYPTEDYSVLVYEWPEFGAEFDPAKMTHLNKLLNQPPTTALQLEVRRSKGETAICDAMALTAHLLGAFKGIAYDTNGDLIIIDSA